MSQVKSRDRVKERGEVFTAERVVNAMLDALPADLFTDPDATFLEPTCGHGNFLVEILRRKLANAHDAFTVLRCVSSLYGLDIAEDNIDEARARLFGVVADHVDADVTLNRDRRESLLVAAAELISVNVKVADTLNCDVEGTEYAWHRSGNGDWYPTMRSAVIWRAAA
jgi:hypothetical protein